MNNDIITTKLIDENVGIEYIAIVQYVLRPYEILLDFNDSKVSFYGELDIWDAYEKLMLWLEEKKYKLFLMGCRYDVKASGMSRDMSNGLAAYILTIGKKTDSSLDIVNIFTPTDSNNIGSLADKRNFFEAWKKSIREIS